MKFFANVLYLCFTFVVFVWVRHKTRDVWLVLVFGLNSDVESESVFGIESLPEFSMRFRLSKQLHNGWGPVPLVSNLVDCFQMWLISHRNNDRTAIAVANKCATTFKIKFVSSAMASDAKRWSTSEITWEQISSAKCNLEPNIFWDFDFGSFNSLDISQ